jgi:HEAT repeat protein
MLSLSFIWMLTFLLVTSSVGTMLVLIARRYRAERNEREQEARLRDLRPVLFRCLEKREPLTETLGRLSVTDRRDLTLLARRLISAIKGPAQGTLIDILRALGHVRNLLDALRHGSVPARLQATVELAWFDQPDVHAALRHALQDRLYGVRIGAARALLTLGSRDTARDILSSLTDGFDPLPLSLRPLFRQLARADSALMRMKADDPNHAVAVLAIESLVDAPDAPDFEQLCHIATEHASKDARASALRTLGLLALVYAEHTPAPIGALSEGCVPNAAADKSARALVTRAVHRGLYDRDWEVRNQAVICALRLELVDEIPRLIVLHFDPQWWIRFRSVQAVALLKKRARRPPRRASPQAALSGAQLELAH